MVEAMFLALSKEIKKSREIIAPENVPFNKKAHYNKMIVTRKESLKLPHFAVRYGY